LADFLCRAFAANAAASGADQRTEGGGWSGAKGGELRIDGPGQHVLERSALTVSRHGEPGLNHCSGLQRGSLEAARH
jgi:hypothetical protein